MKKCSCPEAQSMPGLKRNYIWRLADRQQKKCRQVCRIRRQQNISCCLIWLLIVVKRRQLPQRRKCSSERCGRREPQVQEKRLFGFHAEIEEGYGSFIFTDAHESSHAIVRTILCQGRQWRSVAKAAPPRNHPR